MLPVLIVSTDGIIDDFLTSYKKEHDIKNAYVLDVSPEKGFLVEHSLEVRNFVSETTSMHPYMVIMRKFDTAASNIQNSLLKTIEEDSEKVHFILVVSDQSRLLPTILSRVGQAVQTISPKEITGDLLQTYNCSLGTMTYPEWLSMTAKISKSDAVAFLDEVIIELEKRLTSKEGSEISAALHELIFVRKGLRDNNMYYEYALDAAGHILDSHNLL
ncbi:hypothetical protein KBC70_00250 [Candidatus Woesebacteria bacterium]|jgi:DNA polymerase III delta prime subunit|nr:hypothetical protein [Candidatus Woesebacteria bacterium]